jgi:hypothetical protein
MALILSGSDGLSDVDGSASTPAIRGTDTNTGIFFPAADTIAFAEGGTESMRIDSAGNLGIGTSSPTAKTTISGAVASVATGQLLVKDPSYSGVALVQGGAGEGYLYNISNSYLAIGTNNAERMRIDSSGNLLVGTTSAQGSRLDVRRSGSGPSQAVIRSQNTGTAIDAWSVYSVLPSTANNSGSVHFGGETTGINAWYLLGNGTSTWSSDARLKKNIETTRNGYLQDLCQLRVVKYNWINHQDTDAKELGLIAQEVEQVFPGLVQDDLRGEIDGVTYKTLKGSVLPYMLLKAIQEQQEIIEDLKARLEVLESK